VPSKHTTDIPINFVDDSSALVYQRDDHTHPRKPDKGHEKCYHCGKLGHKIGRCYVLHGHPPKSTALAQTASPVQDGLFINLMLKMFFLIGISRKKFIWSNPQVLLLRGVF